MKTETRIINKNSGVIHKIDEVYYYDDNNYVIFTEDKNCFPSENVRFLTTNEKYSELSKHFVSTLNKNGELDKLKNSIKKLNKITKNKNTEEKKINDLFRYERLRTYVLKDIRNHIQIYI